MSDTELKQQNTVELTESQTLEQSKKIFQIRLEAALKHANLIMAKSSSRNIQRAVDAAITLPVGLKNSKKFTNKQEVELAGLLAQILDLRTVLQGYKVREEQANNKGEKNGQ